MIGYKGLIKINYERVSATKISFDRELFASAVGRVCRTFKKENLKEQPIALYEFLCGKDVFVILAIVMENFNLPNGVTRSL